MDGCWAVPRPLQEFMHINCKIHKQAIPGKLNEHKGNFDELESNQVQEIARGIDKTSMRRCYLLSEEEGVVQALPQSLYSTHEAGTQMAKIGSKAFHVPQDLLDHTITWLLAHLQDFGGVTCTTQLVRLIPTLRQSSNGKPIPIGSSRDGLSGLLRSRSKP